MAKESKHYYTIYVDGEVMSGFTKGYSPQDAVERYVNTHAAQCLNKQVLAYKVCENPKEPLTGKIEGYTSFGELLENGLL
jgi:hypothetical protein